MQTSIIRMQVSSISGSSSEDEDEAKPALHRSPQTIFLNAGQYRVVKLLMSRCSCTVGSVNVA